MMEQNYWEQMERLLSKNPFYEGGKSPSSPNTYFSLRKQVLTSYTIPFLLTSNGLLLWFHKREY